MHRHVAANDANLWMWSVQCQVIGDIPEEYRRRRSDLYLCGAVKRCILCTLADDKIKVGDYCYCEPQAV